MKSFDFIFPFIVSAAVHAAVLFPGFTNSDVEDVFEKTPTAVALVLVSQPVDREPTLMTGFDAPKKPLSNPVPQKAVHHLPVKQEQKQTPQKAEAAPSSFPGMNTDMTGPSVKETAPTKTPSPVLQTPEEIKPIQELPPTPQEKQMTVHPAHKMPESEVQEYKTIEETTGTERPSPEPHIKGTRIGQHHSVMDSPRDKDPQDYRPHHHTQVVAPNSNNNDDGHSEKDIASVGVQRVPPESRVAGLETHHPSVNVSTQGKVDQEHPHHPSGVAPANSINNMGDRQKEYVTGPAIITGLSKPKYPLHSRINGEEGVVVLSVEILASGRAGKIEVIGSSGYLHLDRAAPKALEKAVFIPARVDGKAVTSTKRIAIRFKLTDPEN